MTGSRAIPSTRFGTAYRVFLACGGLVAIIGIGFAGRRLLWLTLHGATDSGDDPLLELVKIGLRLLAWSLIAFAAYTGWRRGMIPATWILVSIVLVAWALIAVQWYEG
jgi:hypothetical protein